MKRKASSISEDDRDSSKLPDLFKRRKIRHDEYDDSPSVQDYIINDIHREVTKINRKRKNDKAELKQLIENAANTTITPSSVREETINPIIDDKYTLRGFFTNLLSHASVPMFLFLVNQITKKFEQNKPIIENSTPVNNNNIGNTSTPKFDIYK